MDADLTDAELSSAAAGAARAHRWSAQHRDQVRLELERFFVLARRHPGEGLVPARDVDLLWHEFLEVSGGAGPRHVTHTTADADARFARTVRLYVDAFGPAGDVWRDAAECQVDEPPPDE